MNYLPDLFTMKNRVCGGTMNIIDLNEEQIDEIETRLDTYDENYITTPLQKGDVVYDGHLV